MEFSIEQKGKTLLSGESSEYQIEVDHGGWGGQLGNGMLVSAIIRTINRIGNESHQWESEETFFLSLDKEAAM